MPKGDFFVECWGVENAEYFLFAVSLLSQKAEAKPSLELGLVALGAGGYLWREWEGGTAAGKAAGDGDRVCNEPALVPHLPHLTPAPTPVPLFSLLQFSFPPHQVTHLEEMEVEMVLPLLPHLHSSFASLS